MRVKLNRVSSPVILFVFFGLECRRMSGLKKPLPAFAIVPTAMVCDPRIKLTALRVYAVLVSHKGRNGRAWCAIKRLSAALGISKPNACKALRQLQEAGYILKWEQGGQGPKDTSLYAITPPEKLQTVVLEDNLKALSEAKNFAPPVVSRDTGQLSHETTKPILEDITPPLSPPPGGKADGPDGPTSSGSLGAANAAHADGPDGPALFSSGSPKADQLTEGPPASLPVRSAGGAKSKTFSQSGTAYTKGQHFANRKLQDVLGFDIVMAANDPKDENYLEAVTLCKEKASELGLGWKPISAEQIDDLKSPAAV